jgi:Brp/Blh family beta-carotene 15,15'-monooxygenase
MKSLRWGVSVGALTLEWLVGPVPHPALVFACVVLLATIGMGHGGLDLWLARRADPRGSLVRLLLVYAVGMVGMGSLWLVSAPWAFAVFLALSAYHFGEVRGRGPVLAFTHGLFIIGAAASSRPEIAAPVMLALGLPSVDALPSPWVWLVVHLLMLAFLTGMRGAFETWRDEALDSVLLFVLLSTVHPLAGFTLYFTLWHAAEHVIDISRRWGGARPQVGAMIRAATPTTAAALLGLAAWLYLAESNTWPEAAATLVVLLSVLTVPHAAVVTWARQRADALGPRAARG